MKRVVYVDNVYGTKDKYVLRQEYDGFGVYGQMTPSGYFVHQDWLITNGDTVLIIPSYMDYCKAEVLDCIDSYNEVEKFGINALARGNKQYIAHNSGRYI